MGRNFHQGMNDDESHFATPPKKMFPLHFYDDLSYLHVLKPALRKYNNILLIFETFIELWLLKFECFFCVFWVFWYSFSQINIIRKKVI